MKRGRSNLGLLVAWILGAGLICRLAGAATVELFINTAKPGAALDLTRYGLGQGGLSVEPMFDDHADEIATLRPQTIRLFVQEYFNLYPAHGVYHWDTLDRSIENILATGARPLMCLCLKPRVLYPQINQDIVHPTDYAEWEALIEALVRHCNQEKGYGITYWEVGNEVDIGESGGCPYRFQPLDYTIYYTHTVNAIRRAQPGAKVGGPALAGYGSSIGDALIAYCGNGGAPLDFFSWHVYSSDPNSSRSSIRAIRQKLAPYPALTNTETIIDEWNINLLGNEPTPGFQAAFVLEATSGFLAEGLSRAAYYHIRDHFVVPQDFTWMSPGGYQFMADWWNVQVQNSGLYDKQGQRRPAYHVFQMLGHLRGQQLPVTGVTASIHAFAARDSNTIHVVLWNFGGAATDVSVRFPAGQAGQFRFAQLNPTANRLETLRAGAAAGLDANPLRLQIAPYGVAWAQVGEFKVRTTWGQCRDTLVLIQ
jgi:xylan 1,4-beta-xylosidase